uniref:Uncharacterized protein AlNc14C6G873 n=1 Tax=Albugo laibachii Nc14 TaxID=890382 RepID=F0W1A4_9STRA|nr:conserved hypothetical protein [Albugo laibachii Nc14]|eukprot:CCA14831.1 conserved hypothetical protein [Albugo laibachii Nc14]
MTNFTKHGLPYEGMECLATMEEITVEQGNFCEYQTYPSGLWHPSLFSASIVQHLQQTQFEQYIQAVQKSDCKAELRRLLKKGPPVWIEDQHALNIPENDSHVCKLWFAETGKEVSALLHGAVQGEERTKLWEHLNLILDTMVEDK